MQDTALQQVMSIVGCNRSTARALLMHFRWDVDSLCGKLHVPQEFKTLCIIEMRREPLNGEKIALRILCAHGKSRQPLTGLVALQHMLLVTESSQAQ